MSSKSRKRKAALRAERRVLRKFREAQLALYRSRRLPGETAKDQVRRTLIELRYHPEKFIEPATFKFISVGYNQ